MRSKSLIVIALLCTVLLTGCQNIQKEDQVFSRYHTTELKISTPADILPVIAQGEELTTQSESVIVAWNQKKEKDRIWFNMVAFDENELTAVAKYAFASNETPVTFKIAPGQNLRFDASLVLSEDILGEPYTSENARRIAFIRQLYNRFDTDINAVRQAGDTLDSASMMIKQFLNKIMFKLEQSPALAARLDDLEGMKFDHMNFGLGRIRMVTEGDIVKVKVKIGSHAKDFAEHIDVQSM